LENDMAFDKNKLYLVPPSVVDIVLTLNETNLNQMQRDAYIQRLEAIRDYIDNALPKLGRK